MALLVLGLDALDHELLNHYGCDTLSLANKTKLETFSHSYEHPVTTEVWPTVATGLHPRDHGISKSGASEWDNPLVAAISKVLNPVPQRYRERLGDVAQAIFGADWEFQETDAPTFFDGRNREVHNWPGVHNSEVLRDRWRTLEKPARSDDYSARKFNRKVLAGGAEKFGWVTEMLHHDLELIGAHVHVLDLAGHAYGRDEEAYRGFYDWMDERVAELLAAMGEDDELVILSDHGMGVPAIDGDEPGHHTWRAVFSTTIDDGDLPKSVFEVKDWIEHHVGVVEGVEVAKPDIDVDHLEDLGYL